MVRHTAALALIGVLATPGVRGEAMELTESNFDEQVFKSDKFVFVKFLAPWCGHCKKLKPDWDRLGDHFNKPDSRALIADVDCTQDNAKSVCEKHGVSGYPTIKYYSKATGEAGESYDGDREYNKLKKFVKSNSKPPCVLETLENCNKKEKAFIETIKEWDATKVSEEAKTMQEEIDAATKLHKDEADLFEQQKEEAMATMKRQEEAKKAVEKTNKENRYKLLILEQATGKKDEL